ncbi:MAG: methyltransferase domain-containing protein [Thermoflexales bacterium]|nr:methyltransferase domain-containing protein [Thermoflexales bacterium]
MLSLERQNAYRARFAASHPGWQPSGPLYEGLVRRYARAGASWLDVGCGRGGIVELLGEQVGLCAGIDPDPASLREHRAGLVRLSAAYLERLPFASGSFEMVTCSWVLEHLPDPPLALAEVARVLRPGGHFVFLTPNALNSITWLNRLAPARAQRALVRRLYQRDESDTFEVHYRANTPARLDGLLRECGLQCVEMALVGDPTYVAFNDTLFALAARIERCLPPAWRVHIVGDYAAFRHSTTA